MTPKKIIIVEDDKMLCTIFKMFLKDLGHTLSGIFCNGQEAIDHCKNTPPDMVFMDIHLQGEINGIEAADIIQRNYKIPVVFLSSDTEDETIKKAMSINCYGFLVKPTHKVTLTTAIEQAVLKYQYETKPQQLSRYYHEMLQATDRAVIVLHNNKIDFINTTAAQLLQQQQEQLINSDVTAHITPESLKLFNEKIHYVKKNNIRIEYFPATWQLSNNTLDLNMIAIAINFPEDSNKIQLILKERN